MSFARVAAAALLLFPALAAAGVIIEGKDGEDTQRFLMEGKKLRMDSGKDGEAIIFDSASQTSVQLDPANKTYTEFTKEDFAQIQAMAKGATGAKTPRTVKYEKTGKTDKALGKTCDVYRVVESGDDGDDDEQTMCVAPFAAFGMTRSDFAPFLAFGDFASQLSGGEVERSWADLPGVPLIAWEEEDGQVRETFRATSVDKRSVPASEFAVPAGWKKGPGFAEQMRQMKQMQQDMQQNSAK